MVGYLLYVAQNSLALIKHYSLWNASVAVLFLEYNLQQFNLARNLSARRRQDEESSQSASGRLRLARNSSVYR